MNSWGGGVINRIENIEDIIKDNKISSSNIVDVQLNLTQDKINDKINSLLLQPNSVEEIITETYGSDTTFSITATRFRNFVNIQLYANKNNTQSVDAWNSLYVATISEKFRPIFNMNFLYLTSDNENFQGTAWWNITANGEIYVNARSYAIPKATFIRADINYTVI